MNDYSHSSEAAPSWIERFGLHLAFSILLGIFLLLNTIQFINLLHDHGQLSQAEAQLTRPEVQKQVSDAQLVARKLDALIRELVVLSATNANAKQILNEFHIQGAQAPTAH